MVLQPEPVAQGDQLQVAVTGAHESEADVASPESVDDLAGGPDRQIDAVLRTHHPDVGHQVPTAAPQLGGLRATRHASRVGTGPDHRHLLGGLAPPRRATAAYDSLVEVTRSAVRNVIRSRNSRPTYAGVRSSRKRER